MSLDALLDRLEIEASSNDGTLLDRPMQCKTVSPVTSRSLAGLPEKPCQNNVVTPVSSVNPESDCEKRHKRVLAMLAKQPESRRAILTDLDSDPDNVILTIVIRGLYTFEMLVPKEKYDGFLLLEILNRAVVH